MTLLWNPDQEGDVPGGQWLTIQLPIEGMQVQSLIRELKIPHAVGQLRFKAAKNKWIICDSL